MMVPLKLGATIGATQVDEPLLRNVRVPGVHEQNIFRSALLKACARGAPLEGTVPYLGANDASEM